VKTVLICPVCGSRIAFQQQELQYRDYEVTIGDKGHPEYRCRAGSPVDMPARDTGFPYGLHPLVFCDSGSCCWHEFLTVEEFMEKYPKLVKTIE